MARLSDHRNCPNPVQYGCSPIKTVYIRDTESGKPVWKPVGWICTGCGVFRSRSGWFPSGKTEPECQPWQPSKEVEKPVKEEPVSLPDFVGDETPVTMVEDYAHADGEKPPRQPYGSGVRVTTSSLADLLLIPEAQVVAGVKDGSIPVRKDRHRHWAVDPAWHRVKLAARVK